MDEFVHFKGDSNCEDPWPLEKKMIFHGVDFGQNKYEFYLDMLDTPRIWRDEVLLDVKEV